MTSTISQPESGSTDATFGAPFSDLPSLHLLPQHTQAYCSDSAARPRRPLLATARSTWLQSRARVLATHARLRVSSGAAAFALAPDLVPAGSRNSRDRSDMLATHRATGTIGSSGDGFSWGDKTPAATRRRGGIAPVEAIAIGSSTGGPQAIAEILKALKGAPPRPIFVTQHMPPSFTAVLAEQIAKVSGRACSEGHDGEVVEGDRIYVAPGGRHMEVGRCGTEVRIALSDAAPENFCRPAVDPMLRSLAHVYGAGICVVILTGMGHDGLVGCERVHSVGGRILVQDAATSVVWGMPGAVANRGIADAVLPIDRIAPALLELLRHRWP